MRLPVNELGITIFFVTIFTIGIFFLGGSIGYFLHSRACYATWGDSNYEYRYSFYAGCQLKLKDGSWVTEHVIRKID